MPTSRPLGSGAGMSPKVVRRYVDDWGLNWWLIGLTHALIPATLVWLLWGVWNPRAMIWFSIVEIGVAFYWAYHGWEPWNMTLETTYRGRHISKEEHNPIQAATARFFKTPKCRMIQFVCVASGSVFPWIVGGFTHFLGFRPIKPGYASLPGFGMGVLGFVDASRGRSLAFRFLAKEFDRNWGDLTKESEELGGEDVASREDDAEGPISFKSIGELRKSGNVSNAAAIAWLVLLVIVALVSAYLRGRARRHGF